jgi:glycerol kinase
VRLPTNLTDVLFKHRYLVPVSQVSLDLSQDRRKLRFHRSWRDGRWPLIPVACHTRRRCTIACMRYLLALDQGTPARGSCSSTSARRGWPGRSTPSYPEPGWVEHDPELLWQTQLRTARQLLAEARVSAREVAAIGITDQRETTLLWERASGRPRERHRLAGPPHGWTLRTPPVRTPPGGAGLEPMIRDKTGLLLDPYFSATKLAWFLDHVPGACRRAECGELCFGTVDSFLLFRLTGSAVHATDCSNAARTLLFNIHPLAWDEGLLRLFEIPRSLLPEVWPSSHVFGGTEAGLFGAPIPIAAIAGDQQAATFAQACFEPGMVKNTYGTGSFLLYEHGPHAGRIAPSALDHRGPAVGGRGEAHLCPRRHSVFVTGAAVQWLRDGLGLIRDAAETRGPGPRAPGQRRVYLVPAFVGLGAPYWDPEARGTLMGLTRGAGPLRPRGAGGGVLSDPRRRRGHASGCRHAALRAAAWRATISSYSFSRDPAARTAITETTALGTAYLAGLATGLCETTEAIAVGWRPERRFEPVIPQDRRDAFYAGWKQAVARARLGPEHLERHLS